MSDDELSPEDIADLQKFLGSSAPAADEKFSVHKFLHDVSISKDTTKTGFLTSDEVGTPKNPARTFKGVSLICKDIIGNDFMAEHFNNEAEILTSTSLSKDAKLISLAVIQRRQLEDIKPRKTNKGWFGQRGKKGGEED